MIVRKMNLAEFDSTMILFGYYRDEAILAIPRIEEEYDENSVIETIRTYSSNIDYCWFNAYENSRPVGFIAGYASACPWNKKIIDANIAFIYLLESHRTMDNFRELMTKFEEWAKTIEASNITAGDIGINPERTQKLYEHFGFKSGVWMGKELINE
jgi:GNAT superfamily N-acetyltransferase